jgi:hypothetical protein
MFRVHRTDTVRWPARFVVVVAAHGMAALSLLESPAASHFDAGAPVVMLEFPEEDGERSDTRPRKKPSRSSTLRSQINPNDRA